MINWPNYTRLLPRPGDSLNSGIVRFRESCEGKSSSSAKYRNYYSSVVSNSTFRGKIANPRWGRCQEPPPHCPPLSPKGICSLSIALVTPEAGAATCKFRLYVQTSSKAIDELTEQEAVKSVASSIVVASVALVMNLPSSWSNTRQRKRLLRAVSFIIVHKAAPHMSACLVMLCLVATILVRSVREGYSPRHICPSAGDN
jgi:hypothetical protein